MSGEPRDFSGFCVENLGIVWLDRRKMAEINRRYLRYQGATDVLTFDYGNGSAEILICLDVARKQAQRHRQTLDRELTLYLVHGILHLAGFGDDTLRQIHRMRQKERLLLRKINEIGC